MWDQFLVMQPLTTFKYIKFSRFGQKDKFKQNQLWSKRPDIRLSTTAQSHCDATCDGFAEYSIRKK